MTTPTRKGKVRTVRDDAEYARGYRYRINLDGWHYVAIRAPIISRIAKPKPRRTGRGRRTS